MKINQNIPFLKSDYLNYDWIIGESQYYIFHFFKGSLAEKEIDKITRIQEEAYSRILKILKLESKIKISYYFYPSRKIKEGLMGDEGHGNAIWQEIKKEKETWKPKKLEIHAVYNKKVKCIGAHEDTHLLTLPWGVAIYLFCEGIAEFMSNGWHGKDIDLWTRDYSRKDCLYSIRFLVDNKNWDQVDDMIAYPQAGSFARFLINDYGLEKFKEVYKKLSRENKVEKNISIIEKSYSLSLGELGKKMEEKV
jgi:hypothetical protein